MIAAERETSLAYSDDDAWVQIYTCIRPDITALKRKLRPGEVELLREGKYADGTLYAFFRVRRWRYGIARAVRPVTTKPREISRWKATLGGTPEQTGAGE